MALTSTERVYRTRRRRRLGRAVAQLEIDPIEIRKLQALGYLPGDVVGDKGAAFDEAAGLLLSDTLAAVTLPTT